MSEETLICREDAEGVAAIVNRVGFLVQAVGGEEDTHALAAGDMVVRFEVNDLVGNEDEAEDFGAQFGG